jgi:hypothetical protein
MTGETRACGARSCEAKDCDAKACEARAFEAGAYDATACEAGAYDASACNATACDTTAYYARACKTHWLGRVQESHRSEMPLAGTGCPKRIKFRHPSFEVKFLRFVANRRVGSLWVRRFQGRIVIDKRARGTLAGSALRHSHQRGAL